MTSSLVIGKFYPPHNGHLALIARAAQHTSAVVVVMAAREESISLDERVDWIRQASAGLSNVTVVGVRDDAPVDYRSSIAWTAHVELIAAALRVRGLPGPDVVVTSESYGERLAAELGARSELFDLARAGAPVSGTAVRADPVGLWGRLPDAVRRGLATRIVVVGAESTGTTTLAGDLLDHYRARPGNAAMRRVEEYGRQFTYELYDDACARSRAAGRPEPAVEDLVWRTEHFARIARRQQRWEDDAALAHPLVVVDTDAFATSLWERRYVGPASRGAASAVRVEPSARRLYLVTDHVGVPFEQDGWRDGAHLRATMHDWFVDGLTAAGHSWILLRGSREERFEYAVRAVDAQFARGTSFAAPPASSEAVAG
ncbi:MAG: AAA family ATPase [Gordonia sp. (in: high G+C Gram-positive bacteria)]